MSESASASGPVGGLVVIVPTFRRPRPLVWSLSTVLTQEVCTPGYSTRRVVVVNNGTPRAEVDAAVERAASEHGAGGWSIATVHRDPPMDPALSWYSALQDETEDGDVAFLHGDDDLLLPGSLHSRAAALTASGATLLLSRAHAGLYFDSGPEDRAFLRSVPDPIAAPLAWKRIESAGLVGTGATFIGNHAYRIGEPFRAAVALAKSWTEELPASVPQRLGMLPFLVALAVGEQGALAAAEAGCVLRGQGTSDLTQARFGHSSWMPGVLYLTCLRVLMNRSFRGRPDLDPLREEFWRLGARWRLPSLASPKTRRDWMTLGGSSLLKAYAPIQHSDTLRGIAMVLRALSGTQALMTRLFGWRDGLERRELLELLWAGHE